MKLGDSILSDPQDIVNSFPNFFSSVYTTLSSETQSNSSSVYDVIDFKSITDETIISAIGKLNNKISSGPDNIQSLLVKDCYRVLIIP